MALWYCAGCTAAYAVGLAACPQCGSTDYTEDTMPKISKGGGPSYEPGKDPNGDPATGPAPAEPQAPAVTEPDQAPSPAPDEHETPPLPPQHE